MIAIEGDGVERDILVDDVQPERAAQRAELPAQEGVARPDRGEERARADVDRRIAQIGPRPGISELAAEGETLAPDPEIVADLDGLLLVPVGGAEDGERSAIAE